MYDIAINSNGTYTIRYGDLVVPDYATFISQRIYSAIMDMPPDLVTGISADQRQTLLGVFEQYFSNYFAADQYINGNDVMVYFTDGSIGDAVSILIEYTTEDPLGKTVTTRQGFSYSFTDGALTSVDLEPEWLMSVENGSSRDIEYLVTVDTFTRDIELPVKPYLGADESSTDYPIYLLTEAMLDSFTNESVSFSIPFTGERYTQVVARYVEGFNASLEIITDVTVDETDLDYQLKLKDGDYVIICKESGTVTGSATKITALQSTEDYFVGDELVVEPVYRLRPAKGKYFARFPKTITAGDYVVKYRGISDQWVSSAVSKTYLTES